MEQKSERYWWYNDESKTMLNRGYLLKGETVEDAVNRIVNAASKYLVGLNIKNELKEAIERGWISLASPIWANMGTDRGLPISCFGVSISDNMESITSKLGEVMIQTKYGGGTSAYFGKLRNRGAEIKNNGKSNGPVSFMKLFDTSMLVVSQGGTRKGAFASYLDIDHPDVEEFLQIKDIGNDLQNIFYGVCITDEWFQSMIEGDKLKRDIWAKVLRSRQEKGLPYIFFTDNVNNNKPQVYKDKNLQITHSNLCSEIALHDNENESFVCCLSSLNLELYDEWKNTNTIEVLTYFLDAVLSEFILKTTNKPMFEQARNFAMKQRAIGIGVLGYHSYLQKNNIPFESWDAQNVNRIMFRNIDQKSHKASKYLAELYGEPELMKGYGLRNVTTMSIAPTTSSSSILGQTSPGIEPFSSNYYKVGLAKGNFIRKNKYLEKLLESKGENQPQVWESIMKNAGSVQHLDFLTQEEKNIFKTFSEISQKEIILQAAIRQKFIDQAQSLNLNIPPELPAKEVNKLLIFAWQNGIKTLYYQRSQSVSKEFMKNIVTCKSCEG